MMKGFSRSSRTAASSGRSLPTMRRSSGNTFPDEAAKRHSPQSQENENLYNAPNATRGLRIIGSGSLGDAQLIVSV